MMIYDGESRINENFRVSFLGFMLQVEGLEILEYQIPNTKQQELGTSNYKWRKLEHDLGLDTTRNYTESTR